MTSLPSRTRRAAGLRLPPRAWLWGLVALAVALGLGLALAELLMSPPAGELQDLGAYLAVSGVVTLAVGWAILAGADRVRPLGIRGRLLLGVILATAVAMLNVYVTARLMFVSTTHDLPLLITALAFSAIVTVFFSLVVAAALAARLRTLADGVAELSEGSFEHRVPDAGRDEIATAARHLNTLALRLQRAEEQRTALDRERRDLTAAISHDLRTPLASVRAVVEALEDGIAEDEAERHRYYGTIRHEIDRVGRMLDDLFELARLDAGALELDRRPVALHEIAAEVVDAMQAQAGRRGITLLAELEPGDTVGELDGARLERAIGNLVRNAIEHTPSGGEVVVRAARRDGQLAVEVRDSGPGIDAEDLPRIWERFYRGERSRHRGPAAADGAGLGLAIVRGIVEAHGGAVAVTSTPGSGATFSLTLPAANPIPGDTRGTATAVR